MNSTGRSGRMVLAMSLSTRPLLPGSTTSVNSSEISASLRRISRAASASATSRTP
uniref:Uncharacterized protein n=1 Tax=Phenylobacterium glaciei TaxID=2803784 RepID=A0A974P4R7_9CAUL|nr:hypothetical protein JKL49_01395 [Phenylobacterium glaciei]